MEHFGIPKMQINSMLCFADLLLHVFRNHVISRDGNFRMVFYIEFVLA